MPRRPRGAAGGNVYHVLNRACGRLQLFRKDADFLAFEQVLAEACQKWPGVRLLSYCLMPTHFHLVLWPTKDGELSQLVGWVTLTHTQRWRHARDLVGLGPVYQGRFKSFAIESDDHFLTVARYVERNPLRAGIVKKAQDWDWSSLSRRHASAKAPEPSAQHIDLKPCLQDWPVDAPRDFTHWVNQPQTQAEEDAMRRHIHNSRPYGNEAWQRKVAKSIGLNLDARPRGRPRKTTK